jgi:CheY-like chemotaxis protein
MLMDTFRILVVDDDALIREATAEYLRSEGHEVVEADGAFNALRLIDCGDIDLVVMDIQMPDVDGIEATRRVHSLRPSLPVLAFTGTPELVRETHGLFQGVFAKPLGLVQLLKSIQLAMVQRGRLH